jgi:hypothetical protein
VPPGFTELSSPEGQQGSRGQVTSEDMSTPEFEVVSCQQPTACWLQHRWDEWHAPMPRFACFACQPLTRLSVLRPRSRWTLVDSWNLEVCQESQDDRVLGRGGLSQCSVTIHLHRTSTYPVLCTHDTDPVVPPRLTMPVAIAVPSGISSGLPRGSFGAVHEAGPEPYPGSASRAGSTRHVKVKHAPQHRTEK